MNLDGNVVNLFDCIRRDPEKLARELHLIPYAREIYDRAFAQDPTDPFERARELLHTPEYGARIPDERRESRVEE